MAAVSTAQDCEGKFELGNCSATECNTRGFFYKVFRITKNATECGEGCEYEDGYQKLSHKPCEAPKCPGKPCSCCGILGPPAGNMYVICLLSEHIYVEPAANSAGQLTTGTASTFFFPVFKSDNMFEDVGHKQS